MDLKIKHAIGGFPIKSVNCACCYFMIVCRLLLNNCLSKHRSEKLMSPQKLP